MNIVFKIFGVFSFIISILFLITSIIFLINLFFPINNSLHKKVSVLCMFIVAILLILLILVFVFLLLKIGKLQKINPIWYLILDRTSIALFILYLIGFVIQSRGMERGSESYMIIMVPGFLPLASSIAAETTKFFLTNFKQ